MFGEGFAVFGLGRVGRWGAPWDVGFSARGAAVSTICPKS